MFGLTPISPDTLSRAAIRADPVKGWLVASRYSLRPRPRLAARPTTSRKDASHRFLQPTSRYEHPYGSFDSRARLPRTLAGPLRDDSRLRWWRGLDPGGASLDGDPPASVAIMTLRGLVNAVFEASCLAWRWRHPVLAGAAIDSPSERRRPTAVLSTASRARDPTSDALCRAQLLPRSMPGFHWEPDPIPPSSRQSRRFLRIRAPSIDECSVKEPATVLTASPPRGGFRNPFAPGAPGFPDGPEARPDASPRGPGSVRRLLQPKMIREHALRILRSLGVIRTVARALTPPGGVASALPPGPKIRSEST